LSKAEWDLAEAVRWASTGNLGMSRAEFVRSLVEERARRLKDHYPAVQTALEGLDEEYFEGMHADRSDHGGRPPSTRRPLPSGTT
jgi:hypothetical protein